MTLRPPAKGWLRHPQEAPQAHAELSGILKKEREACAGASGSLGCCTAPSTPLGSYRGGRPPEHQQGTPCLWVPLIWGASLGAYLILGWKGFRTPAGHTPVIP